MPATLGDLLTEVRYLLRSFTGQHDRTTYLTAGITASDLSLAVADGSVVTTGMVEIDDELLWVDSSSGGTLTVPPYGRGYQGSTAASHSTNAQVLVDPVFPRVAIQRAINETAQAIYPTVFQVKSHEFTFVAGQSSYNLASDVDRILSVSYETIGPSGYWAPLNRYSFDPNANTTSFASGRALHLGESAASGQTVRVLYAAPFTEMTASATTLASAGHAESHRDLLVYGAAWRLLQFVEASRLNMTTVENQERGQYVPPGAASAVTRQVLALYEKRLDEERQRLLQKHPVNRTFRRR